MPPTSLLSMFPPQFVHASADNNAKKSSSLHDIPAVTAEDDIIETPLQIFPAERSK